jgi:hypothetical protein
LALTIYQGEIVRGVAPPLNTLIVPIAFDSAYPTGGYPFKPSDVGLNDFRFIKCENPTGYRVWYDKTNKTLVVASPSASVPAHTHTIPDHTHTSTPHSHTENTAATYTQNATTASTTPGVDNTTLTLSAGGSATWSAGSEVAGSTDLSGLGKLNVFIYGY